MKNIFYYLFVYVRTMNHLAASGRGIYKEFLFNIAPRGRGIRPQKIPRLRSGSLPALPFRQAGVRLNNFVSQKYSRTDLTITN
jgi:hypothetical protein